MPASLEGGRPLYFKTDQSVVKATASSITVEAAYFDEQKTAAKTRTQFVPPTTTDAATGKEIPSLQFRRTEVTVKVEEVLGRQDAIITDVSWDYYYTDPDTGELAKSGATVAWNLPEAVKVSKGGSKDLSIKIEQDTFAGGWYEVDTAGPITNDNISGIFDDSRSAADKVNATSGTEAPNPFSDGKTVAGKIKFTLSGVSANGESLGNIDAYSDITFKMVKVTSPTMP
ncbi:MAG: hypothetical protein ACUVXI_03925 [bacterium]